MVVRLGAAICDAAIMLAYSSAAISQLDIATVHSCAANSKGMWIKNAATMGVTFIGVASTYSPYRPGYHSGGTETASDEPYNASEWAAAIQIDLRDKFGGVQYGESYRKTYALVVSVDKQAIIKINDVGPLKPGRVIDFNEQTMRYFDPTLLLGLIPNVQVTPLLGDDWTPGPIEG